MSGFDLESLAAIIAERARAGGERSYTRKLLDEGIEKCAKKLGEEATEAVVAALSGDKKAVVGAVLNDSLDHNGPSQDATAWLPGR